MREELSYSLLKLIYRVTHLYMSNPSLFLYTHNRHLFLNNNKLMGTISPNIDNLNLAQEIYLGQNLLTGMLPANIGTNRPNNWRFFSVYQNQLTGPIHTNMKLKNMYMLDLSRNEFYGTIPEDINQENFSTLRLLYMDHNLITGTIPGSLMQMRKMKGLFLNDNRKYCCCKAKLLTCHILLSSSSSDTGQTLSLFNSPRGYDSIQH